MSNVSTFPGRDYSPPPVPIPDIPTKTILDYLAAMGLSNELTEAERTQFVSICQAYGLSPWKREVHLAIYGEGVYRRVSIITGYETYLKRAERTGRLNGWSSRVEGEGDHMRAIVTIHRKDWSEPFTHEVFYAEVVQRTKGGAPTSFWQKMPRFQCRKVCISQAFRLCFPDELGGLPVDASELPDAETLAPAPVEAVPVEASPSPVEPSNVQDESAASSPEPETAPPSTPDAPHGPNPERYAGEPPEALLAPLEAFLDDHQASFTERHREWVLMKAQSSRDRSGIVRMLGYAEKVVRNAGLPASA